MRNFLQTVIFIILIPICAFAAQEGTEYRFQDVTATVVVGSIFKFSVDNESIDFGLITPGKRIELYPDRHYVTVSCITNNAKTWYLKMQAESELKNPKGASIPVKYFKWKVDSTDGKGISAKGWQEFKEDTPVLVYTSAGNDNYGETVNINIRFALDTPDNVQAGNYNTMVIYSMTEGP